MNTEPTTAEGYSDQKTELVESACLHVATKLGEFMDDIVVVGGLVPTLLIDSDDASEPHVGTRDLDLGFALGVLEEKRYQNIAQRLQKAGFKPDTNEDGNMTLQRWRYDKSSVDITVDFLISPTKEDQKGGEQHHLSENFAATVAPGLDLAFEDYVSKNLTGETLLGGRASRTIQIAGAGAFMVLKTLAFDNRGENKDAYDLWYVLQNYGDETADIVERLIVINDSEKVDETLDILERDFTDPASIGPRRVAEFKFGTEDKALQGDVVATTKALLSEYKRLG